MKAYIFVRKIIDYVPGRVLSGISVENDVGTHFTKAFYPYLGFGNATLRAAKNLVSAHGLNTGEEIFLVDDEKGLKNVERFLASVEHPYPFIIEERMASEYLREAVA